MLRLIESSSSKEKNGSIPRASRDVRRLEGCLTRQDKVLRADERTYLEVEAVRRVAREDLRGGIDFAQIGDKELLESMVDMQERAESCTGQYEASKANVHKLDRGEMEEDKQVEEANTLESKPRRETRKLSSKLSRSEADCSRGSTICVIWSSLRNFMETIFPMNEVKAVA